jgi:hypothetical protein
MAPVDSYLLAKRQRKDDAMHMLSLGYQPDDGTQGGGPPPVQQPSGQPVNSGGSGSRFSVPMAATPMMVPADQRNDAGAMQNGAAFAEELGKGPIPDFKGRPRPGATLPIQSGDGGGLVGPQGAAALGMRSSVPPTGPSQSAPSGAPSQGISPQALDLLQSVNIDGRSYRPTPRHASDLRWQQSEHDMTARRAGYTPTANGSYQYDESSPAARYDSSRAALEEANVARTRAVASRAAALTPSVNLRQKLIDAGNDPDDVDAALATGDVRSISRLLRPDPVDVHQANRSYDMRHPLPSRTAAAGESPDHRTARQNALAVREQLNATNSELGAAQRSVPKPQNFFASPADSTAYVQSRDAAQGHVRQLRSRADSLTGVLDRTTAQMQDGAQGSPAASHSVDPVAAMNVELSSTQQRYVNLLRAGADTAEAQAALRKANQITQQKYKLRAH